MTLREAKFIEVADFESNICKKVIKGEKIQCPYCGETLLYINNEVCCSKGDFKRYITNELMKIKGYYLLRIGDAPITVYLKNEERLNIDYIDDYNNDEILYRIYVYMGFIYLNTPKFTMSEQMILKVNEIEHIGIRLKIK